MEDIRYVLSGDNPNYSTKELLKDLEDDIALAEDAGDIITCITFRNIAMGDLDAAARLFPVLIIYCNEEKKPLTPFLYESYVKRLQQAIH